MSAFLRTAAVGVAGGVAGLIAMRYAMQGASKVLPERWSEPKLDDDEDASLSLVGRHFEEGESAPMAIGRIGYERITRHPPSDDTKNKLSYGIHWGYGVVQGVTLALLKRRGLFRGRMGGLLYGFALWLVGDELAVPALGLSKRPAAIPKSVHAPALAAHLAYGLAAGEAVDRLQS